MHHSDSSFLDSFRNDPSIEDEMRRLQKELGATGRYPEGKLTPEDKGEIRFAVCAKDGKVVLDFGGNVVWVGFSPSQAREVAGVLTKWADYVEKNEVDS